MAQTNNNEPPGVSYATYRTDMLTNTDLRVVKTRRLLWESLVRLVGTRGIDHITVAEITRAAMVNRATFYRHYEDKADLLERGTAEILAGLAERIEPAVSGSDKDPFGNARRGLRVVLEHVKEHAEFYRTMLGSQAGWRVRQGISNLVGEFLTRRISTTTGSERARLVPDTVTLRIVTAMMVGLVTWWIEQGQPVDDNELIDYYLKLTVLGPYRCMGFDLDAVTDQWGENGGVRRKRKPPA